MRDALSTVLAEQEEESGATDAILAAAFFRKRPLQAGTSPNVLPFCRSRGPADGGTPDVISLAARRSPRALTHLLDRGDRR